MADAAPKTEELVEIELLNDIWDENGTRLETNIKEYDDLGRLKIDPKSLTPITSTRTYMVSFDLAEKAVQTGNARVPLRRKAAQA